MLEIIVAVLLSGLSGYGATAARMIWAAAWVVPW